MDEQQIPDSYAALIAAIDTEIGIARGAKSDAEANIAALDAEQASFGYHPNYPIYLHGGVAAIRKMGSQHILAHAGFYQLAHGEALGRLAQAREESDNDCLITALQVICESDPMLEIAGLAWLDAQGLLKRGALPGLWHKRPLLGLGQPAVLHGLGPRHAHAHRAIYTLAPTDLQLRFEAQANGPTDTFGALLLTVIEAGGDALAAIGAAAMEQDAADRYRARCESFATHQRANGDRRWRWKPPRSRQGHLAVTTAQVRDVPLPAERTRGHAANWLDDHGANPRFREAPEA